MKSNAALSEEQRAEVRLVETMFVNMAGHRGPGFEMTKAEALELAHVLMEIRQLCEARGFAVPSLEESMRTADWLFNRPPATKN
jgi:3-hydroxyacyl-CoA dehydrogenase